MSNQGELPEYVQKFLSFLNGRECAWFTRSIEYDNVAKGVVYEFLIPNYVTQIIIWERGVHEFNAGTDEEQFFHQCDLGLEKDYQVFEEFVSSPL